MSYETVLKRYEAAGQGHLLHFWPTLDEQKRESLLTQLNTLDIERVNRIFDKVNPKATKSTEVHNEEVVEPLSDEVAGSVAGGDTEKWRSIGLEAIAAGQVGVLLMAGGQGTRLGSSAPKGCYDIGLDSHKSLFQFQAERISRLQQVAEQEMQKKPGSVIIPWYIMTSGPTRGPTVAYFEEHAFFGLNKNNVIFFEQGTLPCLTTDGKVILDTPSSVAVAPDGNGGLYAALRQPLFAGKSDTVLSDLDRRGILYVHAYCVDNCLVKIADPIFTGYCLQKHADCAAKAVTKTDPTENVGVIAHRGDGYGVVEYSEISDEMRRAKTGDKLKFRHANIVNHFYTTDFLRKVESFENDFVYHIANKKIPFVDMETGQTVKPDQVNGMKLEMFVFDVFPKAEKFAVLEVPREEEFSPLKNANGAKTDTPDTSKQHLLEQHRRFLERAGAKVEGDLETVPIEISPLVSYSGEGLEFVKGKTFTKGGVISAVGESGVTRSVQEQFDALV